ncbi:aspartyl/asparaginyl beta-hydroxylase domain-containing protein [Paraburkholderia caledonica]|uniref:Aspartate beta-hydroxylase n=1 Tax=Paraburkholderia caledonica TaxID=134536 RepID=A0AB73II25_9BURK|nr:aspartate beta-hydroxylase [Paraburkholderia caledonica]
MKLDLATPQERADAASLAMKREALEYTDTRLRERANELIGLLAAKSDWTSARRLAELMAETGYFPGAMQRPNRYVNGLTARPVHRSDAFATARYLESHAAVIREEVMRFVATDREAFSNVEEPLVERGGQWQEFVFFEAGIRSGRASRTLPATAAILDGLPSDVRTAGVIMLSRVAPNTHIVAHCGETNDRLRLHLGLAVPPEALMRVGPETVRWEVGKCIVFDDSFEHEVWNLGSEERIVLIVDVPHPDASVRPPSTPGAASALRRRIANLMRDAHLRGAYRDVDSGETRLIPDAFLSGKLDRYLTELGAEHVTLDSDGRLHAAAGVQTTRDGANA